MNKKQYADYVKQREPKSPVLKNCLFAFFIGGIICTIGQVISVIYENVGFDEKHVLTYTSMTMIFLGAFLTGIGIYDKIAKHAGAGTIVPITGFANSIVSPAIEFKSEGLVLGLAAKMFVIAGPVLVYGVVSSIVFGLIYYLVRLI